MIELTGKTALVTGAAHRIGAAIARMLHGEGMNLMLHYRDSISSAERLRDDLNGQRPGSAILGRADLGRIDDLEGLVRQTQERFGRLDVLINNASSFYPTPVGEVNLDQWDDLMNSNLRGPFFLAQAAAPLLRAHGGCIVNLVDIHAQRPKKEFPVYSMAKAGNAMMVKALARELGPEVRVNGVAPGVILWPEEGMTDEHRVQILERTVLQRAGCEEDIARTLLFLVRDAEYITGQIIAVDGGRTVQQ
ncbi:MAG: pteridine reductase [Gammaproteobacteria bacterium]|nr:pteridine reductase [Gammaproteobacteria bacterium]MBU1655858.1 pteridine reductase [Gammaproteobacteria bacterium]MBU1960093.1 pteridine reductase [Gammaproteobacteria bacterium]